LGCDSFLVLTVTIVPFKTTNISDAICQGQSITFNGITITSAGTFRDTFQTSQGCDSFIILTVTLNPTQQHRFQEVFVKDNQRYLTGKPLLLLVHLEIL
jgi:hypothetical protein